jgi:YidC/Oxa1 family membrane protein insertase
MSNSPKGNDPKQNPPRQKKELSMEQRMLIAFGLMALVLLITPYLLPTRPDGKAQKREAQKAAQVIKPEVAGDPQDRPAADAAPAPQAAPIRAEAEEVLTVETDVYRIQFSNRGAVVRSWRLKKYEDSFGEPVELVNLKAVEKTGYPMKLLGSDRQPLEDLNNALYAWRQPDEYSVEFEYSDGNIVSRKGFRFKKDSYLSTIESELVKAGVATPHYLVWRGGFGDMTVFGSASHQQTLYYDAARAKLETRSASDAKEGPVSDRGEYTFAGVQDAYFAAVVLPDTGRSLELLTLSDRVANGLDEKEQDYVGVGFGGEARLRSTLFVGPKDLHLLRRVSPKLEQLVDFGWFAFLAKPLFLVLKWLNDNYVRNYGWSIIVITVVINFLLLPLKISSLKSMKKMQALQPQIKALNEKYKGLSLRDPRKAQQNQEMMELYKKHGVNPLGGCMPMLLQIPFLFAFYKVLTVAIELRGADWLWVTDLSRPETLSLRVLPIAMVASQFVLQKMTPATTMDPAQQRIMMLMPLMFGFMFYGVSSGLVLYWLTGNLVAIVQQLMFNKLYHGKPVEVPASTAERKAAAKRVRK